MIAKRQMRSPLKYYGGKFYLAPYLAALIEATPHRHYVETHGGAAHVLFAKRPSPVETYNDLDERVANFFRVLRDRRQAAALQRLIDRTAYCRRTFLDCRETLHSGSATERAWKYYVCLRMSFSCRLGVPSFSYSVKTNVASGFARCADLLSESIDRLRQVQIEQLDALQLIRSRDARDSLFFVDPPYVHDTRREKHGYRCEMSDGDHERLVAALLGLRGQAIVTIYDSPLYSPLESAGWRRRKIGMALRAASQKLQQQRRTEVIYCSPGVTNVRWPKTSARRRTSA